MQRMMTVTIKSLYPFNIQLQSLAPGNDWFLERSIAQPRFAAGIFTHKAIENVAIFHKTNF